MKTILLIVLLLLVSPSYALSLQATFSDDTEVIQIQEKVVGSVPVAWTNKIGYTVVNLRAVGRCTNVIGASLDPYGRGKLDCNVPIVGTTSYRLQGCKVRSGKWLCSAFTKEVTP